MIQVVLNFAKRTIQYLPYYRIMRTLNLNASIQMARWLSYSRLRKPYAIIVMSPIWTGLRHSQN